MKKIILLNKKEGKTPLEALEDFRRKNKEYKNIPMTYAGRLDPMANGLLLILAGEKTKEKEKFLKLEKEYEFKVLFGFSTDTFDLLGKVSREGRTLPVSYQQVRSDLLCFLGKFKQKYLAYSSKTVKGRPLFDYARAGEEVERPEREVEVKEFKFLKSQKISGEKLLENIERRIKKVKGDFRQEEILKIWRKKLTSKDTQYSILSFKIKTGSGVYVRVIAQELGEKLGVPALAFSIKRTRIGKWYKI